MFNKISVYQCVECGRTYQERPEVCNCEKRLKPGKQVGVFELIRRLPFEKWEVKCHLCGGLAEIARTNLRIQRSCGCKPRHIQLVYVDQENKIIEYECSKCGGFERTGMPPNYCCE